MKNKPILIISGDPSSIFFEIFFKALKKNTFRSPLILISSLKLLNSQMKKLKFRKKINIIHIKQLKNKKLNNNCINLINVDLDLKIKNIQSNDYIKNCFNLAFKVLKSGYTHKLLNGPIDKLKFLKKKISGNDRVYFKKF